ncbi:hypothetical protein LOK49_LG10G02697 [Camellia lanceoleosa]|uniref:Uncharacterized protein n=1 Tax=Camellia lanceoleosa TaxID=1840588 RepID=A0ACC0GE30_9ERIC|nr:hypothetical protein LOK49_LG10G02697 [Camellia lanceoleosa]
MLVGLLILQQLPWKRFCRRMGQLCFMYVLKCQLLLLVSDHPHDTDFTYAFQISRWHMVEQTSDFVHIGNKSVFVHIHICLWVMLLILSFFYSAFVKYTSIHGNPNVL